MSPLSTGGFPIVLGTRNSGKVREIRRMMAPVGVEVLSLDSFPEFPEIVEDGESFAENAALKATGTARHVNHWVIAEDSGLAVDALDGAPGIYSARFSDPGATDDRNNTKLLTDLAGVPASERGAKYVCHIAVAAPCGEIRWHVERECRGRITTEPRGTNGFGYDPFFLIPEYHRTFGELTPVVKNSISHRARAMHSLIQSLATVLKGTQFVERDVIH